jgi:hypothetical protein
MTRRNQAASLSTRHISRSSAGGSGPVNRARRRFYGAIRRGEASRELQACCSETGAFSVNAAKIVARAIQQLTGPCEAKKPARVSELAIE